MSSVVAIDSLLASGGRLRILTALAVEPRQEFVHLRQRTQLTDGNLCAHTRRLESAGLVVTEKSFRDRKPVTHVALTLAGRTALEQHARELMVALGMAPISSGLAPEASSSYQDPSEVWVD